MSVGRNTKIYISETITERDLGDEIVAMKNMGKEFHTFRDTALDIWRAAHTNRTAGELLGYVVDEYGVDEETAWIDLVSFLEDMKEKGLVRY